MATRGWAAAIVMALAGVASGAARADVYTFIFSGTVTSGLDQAGLFGPQNNNLAGDQFSITFTYDTALGYYIGLPYDQGYYGSPVTSAVMNINGALYNVPDNIYSAVHNGVFYNQDASIGLVSASVYEQDYPDHKLSVGVTNDGAFGSALNVIVLSTRPEFSGMASGPPLPGEFQFGGDDLILGVTRWVGTQPAFTGFLSVPEPRTWLMLSLGLVATGAALRTTRRRKRSRPQIS